MKALVSISAFQHGGSAALSAPCFLVEMLTE
jgi:hypothetical protein